jgi:hypothetical protein
MTRKQTNSANSTSIKDLLGMVKDDLQKDLLRIEAKIDLHVQIDDKQRGILVEALASHDAILKHVVDELPEKGYCMKVDQMYESIYPREGLSLPQRIDLLMYDRAIIKWTLGTAVTAAFLSGSSLLLRLFGKF